MKTITEFSGFTISDALKKVNELTPRPSRPQNAERKPHHHDKKKFAPPAKQDEAQTKEADSATVSVDTGSAEAAVATVAETSVNESNSATVSETTAPENAAIENTAASSGTTEAVSAATPVADANATPTENAPAAPQIDIPKLIGEAFKMEGDKLTMFMNAIEVAKRRPQHIKRVVVMQLAEGEKAPANSFEKDGKAYLLEHFFVPQPKREFRHNKKGGRFGRDGKKGGRFNKGGRRPPRDRDQVQVMGPDGKPIPQKDGEGRDKKPFRPKKRFFGPRRDNRNENKTEGPATSNAPTTASNVVATDSVTKSE